MTNSTSRAVILAAAAITMSWPMVVASIALRYAFPRPYVANEATTLAYPLSGCFTVFAVVVSVWSPPADDTSWVLRCSLLGAVVGDVWLALGAYFHAQQDLGALGRTLLGGVLYAMPVGLTVGAALGLEIVGLRRWTQRMDGAVAVTRFLGISVLANVAAAGVLWCATGHAGAVH